MNKFSLIVISMFALFIMSNGSAEERLCLENICIGDDVNQLDVEWKKINIDYKSSRAIKAQLIGKTIDDLYAEYNIILITDKNIKEQMATHVLHLQKFDRDILDKLNRVQAICTSLSLTGEVENNSRTKLFVTLRAVADNGGRGRLRVVQIDKEFNIFPHHLRPGDKKKYVAMVDILKKQFPDMVMVRDIDARAVSNDVAFAESLLGYRFFSDVNNPLIFRLRDTADLESIAYDENRSQLCPEVE